LWLGLCSQVVSKATIMLTLTFSLRQQDRQNTIGYQLLSSTPVLTYTAAEGEISFEKVSDTNQSFLKWTTIFSNDASIEVLQDQKYKKLEFFAQFKKSFST
jgi:hypothetical protein